MDLSSSTLRELEAALEHAEAEIAVLEQYAEHLRGVLSVARPAEGQPEQSREKVSATFKMKPVRDEAERILRDAREPLHYREIYRRVEERGLTIGGKDPARTLGAQLSADDERFYPIGSNTGKWALNEWKTAPPQQAREEAPIDQAQEPRDPWDAIDSPALPVRSLFPDEPRQLAPFEDGQRQRVAL